MKINKVEDVFTVQKNWGAEFWITNTDLYCQKILLIKNGKKLSIHYHQLKDELFTLASDTEVELIVYDNPEIDQYVTTWDDFYNGMPNMPLQIERPQKFIMKQWDSFHIPVGRRHTLRSFGDSYIFEASTQHFDSDSYRILRGD